MKPKVLSNISKHGVQCLTIGENILEIFFLRISNGIAISTNYFGLKFQEMKGPKA